jgi:hypothetical protein
MFQGARDDVPALLALRERSEPEDGEVIALRGAAREDDFVTLHAESVGYLVACVLDCLFGAVPVLVSPAPGVPKILRHELEHRVADDRFHRAGGVAIKVNRH